MAWLPLGLLLPHLTYSGTCPHCPKAVLQAGCPPPEHHWQACPYSWPKSSSATCRTPSSPAKLTAHQHVLCRYPPDCARFSHFPANRQPIACLITAPQHQPCPTDYRPWIICVHSLSAARYSLKTGMKDGRVAMDCDLGGETGMRNCGKKKS